MDTILQLWRGWDFYVGRHVQASSSVFSAFHPTGSVPGAKREAGQLHTMRGLRMNGGLPKLP